MGIPRQCICSTNWWKTTFASSACWHRANWYADAFGRKTKLWLPRSCWWSSRATYAQWSELRSKSTCNWSDPRVSTCSLRRTTNRVWVYDPPNDRYIHVLHSRLLENFTWNNMLFVHCASLSQDPIYLARNLTQGFCESLVKDALCPRFVGKCPTGVMLTHFHCHFFTETSDLRVQYVQLRDLNPDGHSEDDTMDPWDSD